MKKVFIGFSIVATLVMALAVFAWFKYCPRPGADEALTFPVDSEYSGWVGKAAELDFVSLDGRRVSSTELRGKVVLIDFWATWCGPCMQSLDHMKEMYTKYHEQGMEVVAINFDEDRAALESVIKSKDLPWPQSFDGRENPIGRKFGITHYPSAWLVDKAGNVRFISALAETDKKISALLAETDAQSAEIGKNANAGYLGRMNQGIATIKKLKAGALLDDVMVRARTISAGKKAGDTNVAGGAAGSEKAAAISPGPAPASLNGLSDNLKICGVMLGAKPSVVIRSAGANHYLSIGDTLRVQTAQGDVTLRCDKIENKGVSLSEANSGALVQLKLR